MRTHLLLACLFIGSSASGGARIVQSLNGQWQYQRVKALAEPPRGGEWKACSVPGYLRGHDYQRAWFRRSFAVPAGMKDQRIKLRFGGVKYNCRVWVNGRRVGGCFGGYQPFEVDVTDAVRLDGPNELAVGVHDWTGIFTDGQKVDFTAKSDWTRVRGIPHDRILAPIGGLYALYGIWDDVTLRSHPAVYVKDVRVHTSVREKKLDLTYVLANESGADAEVDVTAAIEGEAIGKQRALVLAGKTVTVRIVVSWRDPRLWSHVDPYLYTLHTTTSTGDGLQTRFGFR
ncbi:hypothetical protein HQ576_17080, partial [bacterium]|nr:hypothetical protein [bacterium]